MDTVSGHAEKLVAAWYDDPVLFAGDVFNGFDPDPWQVDFMRAVARDQRVIVRSGVGVGKSAAMCLLSMWWLSTRFPARNLITSAKREQILDVFWSEFELWLARRRLDFGFVDFKKTEDKIVYAGAPEMNVAFPRTAPAGNPATIQGQHNPNMLTSIDEIYGIPDEVCWALEGAMSTPGSRAVACGNPTVIKCYAADCFKPGSGWTTFTVSSRDSKNVTTKWCDDMLAQWGADSFQYRTRVLGLPPLDEESQVIGRVDVERCLRNDSEPFKVLESWGLDVAGSGPKGDRTVLAYRKGNTQPRSCSVWRGLNAPGIVEEVFLIWREAKPKPAFIAVDATGIGSTIYDYLRERIRPPTAVVPVNFGERALDKNKYANRGTELLIQMKEWVEHPASCLVEDDLGDEMTWFKAEEGVTWKQTTKKADGRSPDLADAFRLTFARFDQPDPEILERRRRVIPSGATWMANA